MKPVAKILTTLLVATALALLIYGSRQIASQRAQVEVQRKRLQTAEQQAAQLQRELADAERELAEIQQALATHTSEATAAAARLGPRATEIKSWIARVNKLRQLLAQQPEQFIPELKLMSDLDWLAVARQVRGFETEADTRESLAELRSRAKSRVAAQISVALRKYTAANGDQLPTDTLLLLPYFDAPIDAEILRRYRLNQSGRATETRGGAGAIVEREPIDADYDSRVQIYATGGFGSSSPWRMNEMTDDIRDAAQRYAKANDGKKTANAADILPYLQSDIARDFMGTMAAYQAAHDGREPPSQTDLLPYAKTPLVRAELERQIQSRAREKR